MRREPLHRTSHRELREAPARNTAVASAPTCANGMPDVMRCCTSLGSMMVIALKTRPTQNASSRT